MQRFMTVAILFAGLIFSLSVCSDAYSAELKSVECLSGYGRADLDQQDDYDLIPFMVGFGFDIKPHTEKIGFNPPSTVQFQIEPFLSLVTSPDRNMEVGTSFLLKLGLVPESWKLQPYIKGGTGIIWMSQHFSEQTTQFNFISSLGAGINYFFQDDYALTLEYRYRHASNAGIDDPNSGIDNDFLLVGITRLF